MNRYEYYQRLKSRALEIRNEYGLTTARVLRSDLRRIYRSLGIAIDLWPHKLKKIRGAYFRDEIGATVMIQKGLPAEPTIFTLAHELKHHLEDQD